MTHDLLYVSSTYGGGIYVLTYPGGRPIGHIAEYGGPRGLCTDRNGDVYAMGLLEDVIVEYAHDGENPIQVTGDNGLGPAGCAVDPSSGDLAVATAHSEIQVFPPGGGTPTAYTAPGVSGWFFCTYDDKGNLFASGENFEGAFQLSELRKGGGQLRNVNVEGSITPGYAIQWDGHHLALEASAASSEVIIDRLRISGNHGKVINATVLDGATANEDQAQFWIDGHTITVVDGENEDIAMWHYPAGGTPLKAIDRTNYGPFIGVTVSRASKS